jgi:cytochrome P450
MPSTSTQALSPSKTLVSHTMESKVLLALSVSVLVVLLSKLIKSLLLAKPKLNLPPGPWTLPVIGSLHHLIAGGLPHHAMRRLAHKYGPVMMLRLGEVPALVLSSPEAAQEALKTQDLAFADRNVNPTLKALTFDGNDVALAPYGERWRQLRKICVTELLTNSRVQSFQHIREQEVARFLQDVSTSAATGSAVNLTKMVSKFINDTFVLESVGNHCKYHHEFLDAFSTGLRETFSLTVADLFPSSRVLQFFAMAPRKVLACRKRMQRVLEQVIQEKAEAMDGGDEGNEGFVGVLLRLQKERGTLLNHASVVGLLFVSLISVYIYIYIRRGMTKGFISCMLACFFC